MLRSRKRGRFEAKSEWARVCCEGWQEKVYRVQGADGEYENLEEATGYPSDPTGLCGYNCRHTFYPFWPGISEPNEWPPEPGPFEVDGHTYTYYQATQKQRRREREIRALKREQAAYEAIGLKDKANDTARKIRIKTAEYKDFSSDIGIRAKTERLRVCEGVRDVRKKLKDSGIAMGTVDFASASNFANGDARLTRMLRSGDAQQTAEAVNEILDGYGFRESKWSGKVFVGSKDEMKYALGQKEWSCDITIREDNTGNLKTYIHENLHSRSASHFSSTTFSRSRASEEASVELMSQQICQRAGIAHNSSYVKQTNALKEIRTILFPQMSEYEYAKEVFDMPEDMRYTNIVNSVNQYRLENPNMRKAVRDRLNGALAALGGLKEGAKTYE